MTPPHAPFDPIPAALGADGNQRVVEVHEHKTLDVAVIEVEPAGTLKADGTPAPGFQRCLAERSATLDLESLVVHV